jgi:hypothetical protein
LGSLAIACPSLISTRNNQTVDYRGKRARRTAPVGENRVKLPGFFTRGVNSNQPSTMPERRFEITPRGNTSEPSLSTTKLLSAVSPFAHVTL